MKARTTNMFSYIRDWLNKRWPFSAVIRWSLDEEITGGSSFLYTIGSALLAVFLLQVTTGILQLFFYVPTVENAYNSVTFLRTQVPFGWLINQVHRRGADLMVVLVALHLTRVFIFGAYKKPRELTWIIGVGLVITVMALTFTGGPLPWDQKGYWEAEVGTNIPGSIPYIGSQITDIMRGGQSMGQLTLSRLFAIHVGIFPVLLGGLILLHLISFRRFGSVGPWNESKRNKIGYFWPDQVFKDTIVSISVIMIIITLCVFAPKAFYGPADPLDSSFTPKPEWNFLFLYQALKYFHGPLEPVGVVGVPGFFVTLLLLLPFIDRGPEQSPLRRPLALACGILFASLITALTIIGYYSKPGAAPAAPPSPKQVAVAVPESVKEGEQLFVSAGCISCHRVNGKGGTIGPDLSNEGQRGRSRDWLTVQIRDPKVHVPDSTMPAITLLSDQQMKKLVDYLLSLRTGPTAAGTASVQVDKGKDLFHSEGCIGCHTVNGSGGSIGPNLSDEGKKGRSRQWLETQIRNPKSHFADSVMPSFGSLSDRQVSYLVDFLLSLGSGGQFRAHGENTGKGSSRPSGSSSSGEVPPAHAGSSSSAKSPSVPAINPSSVSSSAALPRVQEEAAEVLPKGRAGQAAYMIGNATHGGDIFQQKCASCHGQEGADHVPNPGSSEGFIPSLNPVDKDLFSPDPETFAKNIDVFIQHGATPAGPHPQFHMLPFGDEHQLTQQEIANTEAYILQLNKVDRAEIMNPGIQPRLFFFIVVPGLVVLMLLLAGIFRCLPKAGSPEEK
jgi:ubiquinol-cytochrome c reductase cytochrome b subunit